jgi:two-component system phosphate regulon sensor histidine kinase PhoR
VSVFLVALLAIESAALALLVFLFYQKVKKTRALALDISDIKGTLEMKVRSASEEKKRLAGILESMAEGVVVVDTRQKVMLANTVLAAAFGFDRQKAQGRHSWELFRDPEINEMIEKALHEKASISKEHPVLLSNATFQIQISPVSEGDEFLGVVAVFYDLTKLKELERVRSEFVANVSHELKTPLTSILGFVETLREGGIEDTENRIKFLEIIEGHAKKLYRLIDDLLLLSAIESGKRELRTEPLDLRGMLDRILPLFEKAIAAKKIEIRFEMEPDPFVFRADPKFMEQVFSNLLDNAVKYNREGGRIVFKAFREGDEAKMEIHDTGIGIPCEDLPRIFERFYRVDKSRSRESGGTGLGLSIAKHVVERHGGRMEVWSVVNQGTVFRVILPINS